MSPTFYEHFMNGNWTEDLVFQQDNCPIHTSRETKRWFSMKNINVMEWSFCSPDLNPIENLWAVLARRVYANGVQFETRQNLIERIMDCWKNLDYDICSSLITSMKTRCVKILSNKGAFLKY